MSIDALQAKMKKMNNALMVNLSVDPVLLPISHMAEGKREIPGHDHDFFSIGEFIVQRSAKIEILGFVGCGCAHIHSSSYVLCSSNSLCAFVNSILRFKNELVKNWK